MGTAHVHLPNGGSAMPRKSQQVGADKDSMDGFLILRFRDFVAHRVENYFLFSEREEILRRIDKCRHGGCQK
jgi:hypothetical protein